MKFKMPDEVVQRGQVRTRVFNTREEFQSLSSAILEIKGQHGKTMTEVSDRLYFILKGRGEFLLGEDKVAAGESDTIIVPRGTEYNIVGDMTLFVVHSPAYEPNSEIQEELNDQGIRKMKVIVRE